MATKSSSIPERLNTEATIKALTKNAVTPSRAYELVALEQHDVLNPAETRARLLQELSASADLGTIAEKQAAIEKLSGPSAEAVRIATRNAVLAAYEPARAALIVLCDEIDAKLQAYKAQAIEDETVLFKAHGLPRSATACSLRFDAPLSTVRRHKADLVSPGYIATGGLPNAQHPVLTFLGATV